MSALTLNDRILGGLWGAVVGDALGVPVEFRSRAQVQRDPVTDLREFGTYQQPKGTWSDDSSLMLCSVDSLNRHSFDTADMGHRFVQWSQARLWTPWGKVFDIGNATRQALTRMEQAIPPEEAGGTTESSNGNGSLMRILPVALRFFSEPPEQLLAFAHRASCLTHRHPRSQMACSIYCLMASSLLRGESPRAAHASAAATARQLYRQPPYAPEWAHFEQALTPQLATLPEADIPSSGYVVATLTAALWCLLTTRDYSGAVLRAVNLGEDTDTTGIVTGGLAGVHYGLDAVPERWRRSMARAEDLGGLFTHFIALR